MASPDLDPERVERIVDTFPIADLALALDTSGQRVRALVRRFVVDALRTGGSIHNLRLVAAPTAVLGRGRRLARRDR